MADQDLAAAAAAFAAFEGQRLAELLAAGVEVEAEAQEAVLAEWELMDVAARACWARRGSASAGQSSLDSAEGDGRSVSDTSAAVVDSDDAPLLPPAKRRRPAQGVERRVAQAPTPTTAAAQRRKAPAPCPSAQSSQGEESIPASAGSSNQDWLLPGRPSAAVVKLEEDVEDEPDEQDDEEASTLQRQHVFRTSRAVQLGSQHPDWLTEPAAVAEISLPPLPADEVLRLPAEVASKGFLSSPQLESVAYAARRFRANLPSGVRAGYYLGDGTGCGKGRVIAALAWHLWNGGAKRHIWLSASSDLLADAARDFKDLGAALPLSNLAAWPYGPLGAGKGLDAQGNGIIFASYQLLVASKGGATGVPTPENSRLGQLVDWLRRGTGGACGLIALDEAHRTKNVASAGSLGWGGQSGSKSGMCALELQRACPGAAVLYASATGATEIRHLGYLERLGLWGRGRPHASFEELRDAVEGGGLAAMELLAMTMRAEGMLSCRSLSFKGASFRLLPVSLEDAANSTYSAACKFWQAALLLVVRLLKAKKQEVKAKRLKVNSELKDCALHMRHFWSAQQQFFRQLLICAKVDSTVSLATSAQLRGESVVIAMWSTGESVTEAVAQRQGDKEAAAAGFASAPKEVALRMLNGLMRSLLDWVSSDQRAAEQEFKRLRSELEGMKLPPNPLDDLIQRLGGPSKVAELTGRSRRLVSGGEGGAARFEDRGEGANLEELKAFQMGKKHVAIVTEAASAGISLHCDRRLPLEAQRPRYMICIELPWEADKAIQQLGRVHRSNQRVPPRFAFVVTDLGGEVRFVSAVARRLRILGAMMRGDRNSAHGAVQSLASFDLQNRYGRRALARFFELLRTGQDSEVSFSFLMPNRRGRARKSHCWASWPEFKKAAEKALDTIGLNPDTEDKFEESLSESKSLNVFLNRLLMLEPSIQNALFDAVAELYVHLVGVDRASGSFDDGPEALDKKRGCRTEVHLAHREVLFKDPATGAETAYVRLRLDRGMSWPAAMEALERRGGNGRGSDGEGFYWCNARRQATSSKEVVMAIARPCFQGARAGVSSGADEDEDDSEVEYDLHGPRGTVPGYSFGETASHYALNKGEMFRRASVAELPQVESTWRAAHSASSSRGGERWSEEHVLTGSILSTWAVLGAAVRGENDYTAASRGAQRKIPLVRSRLADGGAVVGVRVRPGRLEEVRYALAALREARSGEDATSGGDKEFDVQRLSAQLEAYLRTQPDQRATWHGWAGAHKVLVSDGLVNDGAAGMLAAQEAMADLDRNGKVDIDSETGVVKLREKPKGNGWYIPPPKKPKTTGRGRGRRGGRGR
eukprot:TRINITY_DN29233_c0_g1_i1.p1 TRINITY_DN29233_c0_g1~~TRINITY_DN29233_c0_g1_i1.p1  ORF type:complete len:1339 (-),score=321.42 TRINITY_DN29233_c0_g1_i1:43-4026(-)